MDAGEFDRRILLQRRTELDDGLATVPGGWSDIATVWAKLIPMSGKEMLAAAENAAFANVRFKIRRDSNWSDLNATDRLLFGTSEAHPEGVPHDIVSVRSEGRGFYLIDAVARGDEA
jgi:SPP1 family predicted phage head-tail adaptor